MLEVIKNAIDNRKSLKIFYEPGDRLIEPHVLGYSKNQDILLRCFQSEGASASNEHQNWKLLRVDKIGSIEPSGSSFDGPRQGYNPNDKIMKGGIIARL